MTSDEARVLGDLRDALKTAWLPGTGPARPSETPDAAGKLAREDAVQRFCRELDALSGHAHRVSTQAEAVHAVMAIVRQHAARRVMAWEARWLRCAGLGAALADEGVTIEHPVVPEEPASRLAALRDLAAIAVGITGATGAIAESGTIVLADGPGRPRVASLLPPVHIALVREADIVFSLPAFLSAHADLLPGGNQVVLITGPSRTADIEMVLTIGVHGPKELHVIVMAS